MNTVVTPVATPANESERAVETPFRRIVNDFFANPVAMRMAQCAAAAWPSRTRGSSSE